MNIGGLTIEMAADIARLRQDMESAKQAVGSAMQSIEKAANLAKTALGALGVGISVNAFAGWIKGAIDAGDAAAELSQKTGVATKDLAGLQLGFRQGGVDGEALTSSMAKMSKQIVEGNKAFTDLGIKTRDSSGAVRSVKDVLYDTADAFEEMQDGTLKSALAQEIFGKTGAALIPTLNSGSKGLREMAEMADKLGLSISDEAAKASDQFNDTLDLLKGSTEGLGRQVAAQLLPTLNAMAGSFLDNVTEGDRLKRASDALSAGLKGLFSAGVLGVEVFNTLGKTVGAVAAALVQAAQGEFKQAWGALKAGGEDIVAGWGTAARTVSDVWTGEGAKTVETMAGISKATRGVTADTKEQEAAQKKAREEMERATKAGADWLTAQDAQMAALQQEISLGRALTEGEKALLKLEEDLRAGKVRLTAAELESSKAKLEEADSLRAFRREQEASAKASEAAVTARLKEFDAASASVLKLDEEIAAQMAANETVLTGVDRTQQLSVAKLRDAAASADRQAIVALERKEDTALYEQFKLQAEKLRELADLKEKGIHIKSAKEAQDAWQKTTDSIGQGLTDSLFRAFESGKGFFKTLWDGIVNTFKTTALKLIIQGGDGKSGIVGSVMGALGLGGSGSAMASTGGGGLGGLGSLASLGNNLSSMFSSASDWMLNFGGNVTGAVGDLGIWAYDKGFQSIGQSLMGNASSIGNFASMAGDVLGYGNALLAAKDGKWGAAAGSAIGTYFGGPIGATIGNMIGGAVDKLFGGNGTHHAGASWVSDGSTGSAVNDGSMGLSWSYGDSVGKYFSKDVQSALKTVTGGAANMLNSLSKSFGGTGGYQVGGYFASDNDRASQGGRSVLLNGRVLSEWGGTGLDKDPTKGLQQLTDALAGQVRDAMTQIDLPTWAKDALNALGASATMEQLASAVQAISQTQSALKGLSDVFMPLGGVFSKVAGLSADATMQLAQFAGGIDALVSKTRSFVANYYTSDEQNAIAAAQIQKALTDAGITATLGSKDDFKALVQGTDVQTETGRKQLALLLSLNEAFAPVGEYLKDQGKTLGDLAAQAPQVAALQLLTDQQASGQAAQLTATEQLNTSVIGIGEQISSGIAALGTVLSERLSAVEAAVGASSRAMADTLAYEVQR